MHGRLPGAGPHQRVAIKVEDSAGGSRLFQTAKISLRVAAHDLLKRAAAGAFAGQHLEIFVLQRPLDHAQAIRLFGMPRAHVMAQSEGVRDEKRAQKLILWGAGKARVKACVIQR